MVVILPWIRYSRIWKGSGDWRWGVPVNLILKRGWIRRVKELLLIWNFVIERGQGCRLRCLRKWLTCLRISLLWGVVMRLHRGWLSRVRRSSPESKMSIVMYLTDIQKSPKLKMTWNCREGREETEPLIRRVGQNGATYKRLLIYSRRKWYTISGSSIR